VARQAEEALELFLSTLNASQGGRAIFGGSDPTLPVTPALQSLKQTVAAELAAAPPGSAPDAVIAAFFAEGGGFDTLLYEGGNPTPAITLGSGHSIAGLPTAQADGIRETLTALTMVHMSQDPTVAPGQSEAATLRTAGAERLITGQTLLVNLTADIGAEQGRMQTLSDLLGAELSATDLVLNDTFGADPYEAAARLNEAQARLEALFTITGRISALALARFLR
jgi:flagellar hook-associated protein 3 FlgL